MGRRGAQPDGGGLIFISHARADAAVARRVAACLRAQGRAVLIDPPLRRGDPFWRQHLAAQLDRCSSMVMIESARAEASPWVQQERRSFHGPRAAVPADAADVQTGDGDDERTSAEERDALRVATERRALAQREAAWLAAWLTQPRLPCRPTFDGDRAWLADGRIELRAVPGRDGHRVWLALEPLSNELYGEFVSAAGSAALPTWSHSDFAAGDLPATSMTWFEAVACAAWFGAELPTDDERAVGKPSASARAAPSGGGSDLGRGSPRAAQTLAPDGLGFRGLTGNTWDWCADPWSDGPSPEAHRVIRGGSWLDDPARCANGARYRNASIDRDCTVGLRLALRPDTLRSSARRSSEIGKGP